MVFIPRITEQDKATLEKRVSEAGDDFPFEDGEALAAWVDKVPEADSADEDPDYTHAEMKAFFASIPVWELDLEIADIEGKAEMASQHPGARKLRHYWTRGKGALKIRWGTPRDFYRCRTQLTKYVGARASGLCAIYHHAALGVWPGQHKSLSSLLAEPVLASGLAVADSPTHDALHRAVLAGPRLGEVVSVPAYFSGLVAALDVDSVGDGFKMLGVDADAITAEMVEFKALRDWADQPLVDDTVSESSDDIDPPNLPVAVGEGSASPEPAAPSDADALRSFLVDQVEDIGEWCRSLGLTSSEEAAVVAFAHSFTESSENTV